MNGGGALLSKKDFPGIAALIDVLVRDRGLRQSVIDGQLGALEKFSRENVSRILLDHVDRVSRG